MRGLTAASSTGMAPGRCCSGWQEGCSCSPTARRYRKQGVRDRSGGVPAPGSGEYLQEPGECPGCGQTPQQARQEDLKGKLRIAPGAFPEFPGLHPLAPKDGQEARSAESRDPPLSAGCSEAKAWWGLPHTPHPHSHPATPSAWAPGPQALFLFCPPLHSGHFLCFL